VTITIDCRSIDASGIGVYLRGCLPLFLETDNEFILIGNRQRIAACIPKDAKNAVIIDCAIKPFSLKELYFFPRRILKRINQSALYYSPYFNIPGGIGVPVFTTIHDIIFPDMSELFSRTGIAARMVFFRRAYSLSEKIFTVSNFSKSRIEYHLGKSASVRKPLIVTHSAIQNHYLRFDRSGVEKQNNILFIGNIKTHKGLFYLLEAFFAARKEGLTSTLTIAGEKDNFRSADRAIHSQFPKGSENAVLFTGFIPDEQLLRLLAQSALLVQPSLYEGFGLPPLEAMVCGTAALVSDIAVFKEIYKEYPVHYFRAGSSADLKKKLLSLLRDKKPEPLMLSETLRTKYTFEKTAASIMQACNHEEINHEHEPHELKKGVGNKEKRKGKKEKMPFDNTTGF